MHRTLEELQRGFEALPLPSRDSGRLFLIVRRPAPGIHEAQERIRLTPEEGVPEDEWNRHLPRRPDTQLAVMRRDLAELIGNGQALTAFGDNLFVELDLSNANLPVGTRLRLGEAVVEVTPMPHTGCQKFKSRFGKDALQFVQSPAARQHNFRGIYWRVIEAGEVRVGSAIEVLDRAT